MPTPNLHPDAAAQKAADLAAAAGRENAAAKLKGDMAGQETRIDQMAATRTENSGDRSPR